MYHQKTYLYGKERWISFGFLCISTLIILLAAFSDKSNRVKKYLAGDVLIESFISRYGIKNEFA